MNATITAPLRDLLKPGEVLYTVWVNAEFSPRFQIRAIAHHPEAMTFRPLETWWEPRDGRGLRVMRGAIHARLLLLELFDEVDEGR